VKGFEGRTDFKRARTFTSKIFTILELEYYSLLPSPFSAITRTRSAIAKSKSATESRNRETAAMLGGSVIVKTLKTILTSRTRVPMTIKIRLRKTI
jgi:hypothetical protein